MNTTKDKPPHYGFHPPYVVFLDIQMDGMNGIEAARNLREQQGDTVLVFITEHEAIISEQAWDTVPYPHIYPMYKIINFLETLLR